MLDDIIMERQVKIPKLSKTQKKKDFILKNHSDIKLQNSKHKTSQNLNQEISSKLLEARLREQHSAERIRRMDQSTYGLDSESLLSKDNFVRSYSKPSNPGKAKRFTNPPNFSIYFESNQLGHKPQEYQNIPQKQRTINNRDQNSTQTGVMYAKDKHGLHSKLMRTGDMTTARTLKPHINQVPNIHQSHKNIELGHKTLIHMAPTKTALQRNNQDVIPLRNKKSSLMFKKQASAKALRRNLSPSPDKGIPRNQTQSVTVQDYNDMQSTQAGSKNTLITKKRGGLINISNASSNHILELRSIQDSFRKSIDDQYAVNSFQKERVNTISPQEKATRFLTEKKVYVNQNHLGVRPKLGRVLHQKSQKRNFSLVNGNSFSTDQKTSSRLPSQSNPNPSQAADSYGVLNKHNNVKVRKEILDKISELVVKKQRDEDRDPLNKMWKKDKLLTNSIQALDFQAKYPFTGVDDVHNELEAANLRIQDQFLKVKQERQRKLDIDDWICSLSPTEETYNQRLINRPETDPSGAVLHEHVQTFRMDKSIVNHIAQITSEQELTDSRTSKLGTNHLISAMNLEQEHKRADESRKTGSNLAIHKQNELFPNNLEYKIRKKLETQRGGVGIVKEVEEEKNLEEKLELDRQALMHQRYLLDGVIRQFQQKKLNYQSASKGILSSHTKNWLHKRDTKTEAAKIGMPRGAYFGINRPVHKPLQVGDVIPVSKSFKDL